MADEKRQPGLSPYRAGETVEKGVGVLLDGGIGRGGSACKVERNPPVQPEAAAGEGH
ncbi:hypothetical protein D3C72_2440210 [compost metagenome]